MNNTTQREQQHRFNRLWSLAQTPKMSSVIECLLSLGFCSVYGNRIREMGTNHYFGSMYTVYRGRIVLNEFGMQFCRAFTGLPSYFGEILATAGSDETDAVMSEV